MREKREKALAMVVVLAITAAFVRFDPLGVVNPLEDEEVAGCDGRPVHLDGREAELLRLHNEARTERGVAALCAQEELMAAARGHSKDMIERGYYDHEAPDGADPGDRISRAGYPFSTYAENISRTTGITSRAGDGPGRGEVGETFEGWMGSPPHLKNLMNPELVEVGIGVASGRGAASSPGGLGETDVYTVDFGARRGR